MCVGVRVRRSKTGLSSHRVSLEVYSSDVCRGQGFADLREGCHGGCRWRCQGGDAQYFLNFHSFCLYLLCDFGLFLAQTYIYGRRMKKIYLVNRLETNHRDADTFPCYLGSMHV